MNRLLLSSTLAAAALLLTSASAFAGTGGVDPDQPADPGEQSGGAGYGAPLVTLPGKPRLSAQKLSSSTVKVGSRASVVLRINRSKGTSAQVKIAIARSGGKTINYSPGRISTNRSQLIRLPKLAAGSYRVTVSVFGASAQETIRGGVLKLTVKPKSVAKPKPTTPSPPAPSSGVFPVRGAYSFGSSGARFGAGRPGHIHEGQDVIGNSGLPIVAPLAGEVRYVSYQADGAGRYIIMRANNGWDMMFAHCQYASAAVKAGERVRAGDRLCLLGSTGASSGPHLHFELWPNGWRDSPGTRPIDPLPQLKKWAGN
jgi:murein DD-endopeptidase MepM/ murein hydrolase activator NlpD